MHFYMMCQEYVHSVGWVTLSPCRYKTTQFKVDFFCGTACKLSSATQKAKKRIRAQYLQTRQQDRSYTPRSVRSILYPSGSFRAPVALHDNMPIGRV